MAIIIPGETPRNEEENLPKIDNLKKPEESNIWLPGEGKSEKDALADKLPKIEQQPPITKGGVVVSEETKKQIEEEDVNRKEKPVSKIILDQTYKVENVNEREADLKDSKRRDEVRGVVKEKISEEIQQQLDVIDNKIKQIEEAGKLDSTGLVPERFIEARKKDIEKLKEQREGVLRGESLMSRQRDEKIEVAKDRLIGIAKEMAEKKEGTEKTKYLEAVDVYRVVTGQELAPKIKERVVEEATAQKLRIISKTEFLTPERLARTTEKIKQREISSAIEERWDDLSDKEKAMYVMDNGQPDIQKFANALEMKRQALEAKGINMPREAYYQMIQSGYEPDKIQVRGFFGRLFGRSEIKMPDNLLKTTKPMSKNDLQGLIYRSETNFNKSAERDAQAELDTIVSRGQKRIRGLREKFARDIVAEKGLSIEKDRQEEIEWERQIKSRQESLLKEKEEAEKKKAKKKPKKPVAKKPAKKKK